MEKNDFRDNFLAFINLFNTDKSRINPIMSINTKAISELQTENTEMLNSLYVLCRLNYITHGSRVFSLQELTFPLKEIKHLSIAASLKIFKRPNHKDRYSHLIHWLTSNPEIFAQIVYMKMLNIGRPSAQFHMWTEDDAIYFYFVTFPAVYNFFMSSEDRENSLSFLGCLLKLHVFLHGPTAAPFIKQLFLSRFLSTNPGVFFENSIEPLLTPLSNATDMTSLKYVKTEAGLARLPYWQRICLFVEQMIRRMMDSIPMLPFTTRQLITQIDSILPDRQFLRFFIVDSLICGYIESNLSNKTILRDACEVIRSSFSYYSSHVSEQIRGISSKISFDALIDAIHLKSQPFDGVSDAISIAGRQTILTPRDFYLLFHAVKSFVAVGDSEQMAKINNSISGMDEPQVSSDDQFILCKPWNFESSLGSIEFLPTFGYDEVVETLSSIRPDLISFSTPADLAEETAKYCSCFMDSSQQLQMQLKSSYSAALNSIHTNISTLEKLGDRLFSALFFINNEKIRNTEEAASMIYNYANFRVLPQLIAEYPIDFLFNYMDFCSPALAVDSLVERVTKRVASLGVPEDRQFVIRKCFFLDFFDQIDDAFRFQRMARTQQIPALFAGFCQDNHKMVEALSDQRVRLLAKAGALFQRISSCQKVSYNLRMAMNAMNLLKYSDDQEKMISISMSGNADVFGFSYFVGGYFKNQNVIDLLMTGPEEGMMKKFRSILQKYHK